MKKRQVSDAKICFAVPKRIRDLGPTTRTGARARRAVGGSGRVRCAFPGHRMLAGLVSGDSLDGASATGASHMF